MIFSGRRAPIAFVFNDHVLEMILLCNNGSTRSCGLITVSILRTCCRTPVHSGRVPRVPTRAIHNAYYKPGRVVRVSCTRSMDSSHRDFFTQAHLSYRCLQRCDNHHPKYTPMHHTYAPNSRFLLCAFLRHAFHRSSNLQTCCCDTRCDTSINAPHDDNYSPLGV
jgi:hypothetical protein